MSDRTTVQFGPDATILVGVAEVGPPGQRGGAGADGTAAAAAEAARAQAAEALLISAAEKGAPGGVAALNASGSYDADGVAVAEDANVAGSPTDLQSALHAFGAAIGALYLSSLGAEQTASKGQPGGYAGLDATGTVPTQQLPPTFRYIGVDEPDTTGWTVDDMWYDTSTEPLQSGVIRRWDGNDFMPAIVEFSATGGTVTEVGGYRVHTFTGAGTVTFNAAGTVDVLLVGGGGGGSGGGGGGGGVVEQIGFPVAAGVAQVLVGIGGQGGSTSGTFTPGDKGGNTTLLSLTAFGGGGGGSPDGPGGTGASGGGGGASSSADQAGGIGITGQGNNGGANLHHGSPYPSGGGGGAGAAGQSTVNGTTSGNGGAGVASELSGTAVWYGGGGGGCDYAGGGTPGTGGQGGGGDAVLAGTANTGGGGGGGHASDLHGAAGGSGVVIIRYPIT